MEKIHLHGLVFSVKAYVDFFYFFATFSFAVVNSLQQFCLCCNMKINYFPAYFVFFASAFLLYAKFFMTMLRHHQSFGKFGTVLYIVPVLHRVA